MAVTIDKTKIEKVLKIEIAVDLDKTEKEMEVDLDETKTGMEVVIKETEIGKGPMKAVIKEKEIHLVGKKNGIQVARDPKVPKVLLIQNGMQLVHGAQVNGIHPVMAQKVIMTIVGN